jgi:hypothetical protein
MSTEPSPTPTEATPPVGTPAEATPPLVTPTVVTPAEATPAEATPAAAVPISDAIATVSSSVTRSKNIPIWISLTFVYAMFCMLSGIFGNQVTKIIAVIHTVLFLLTILFTALLHDADIKFVIYVYGLLVGIPVSLLTNFALIGVSIYVATLPKKSFFGF